MALYTTRPTDRDRPTPPAAAAATPICSLAAGIYTPPSRGGEDHPCISQFFDRVIGSAVGSTPIRRGPVWTLYPQVRHGKRLGPFFRVESMLRVSIFKSFSRIIFPRLCYGRLSTFRRSKPRQGISGTMAANTSLRNTRRTHRQNFTGRIRPFPPPEFSPGSLVSTVEHF